MNSTAAMAYRARWRDLVIQLFAASRRCVFVKHSARKGTDCHERLSGKRTPHFKPGKELRERVGNRPLSKSL